MNSDSLAEKIFDWINPPEPSFKGENDLGEALYTMSELGMWPDGESVGEEQAVLCWALIEKLRRFKYPEKFVM